MQHSQSMDGFENREHNMRPRYETNNPQDVDWQYANPGDYYASSYSSPVPSTQSLQSQHLEDQYYDDGQLSELQDVMSVTSDSHFNSYEDSRSNYPTSFPHDPHNSGYTHSSLSIQTQLDDASQDGRGTFVNASKSQYPINQLAKSTKGSRRKVVKEKKPSKLKGPLSELTADFIAVPVRDMEAFVNRPLPARLEEARKKNGYISRPMNSFMLYRSAYQERTKAFCNETNHQAVSTIVGESWAIEPESVKAKYNRLAVTERDNHQAAHPDYKFRPAKNGPAPRKKAADSSKQADGKLPGSSDLDFDSQDWGATHLRKNRPKLMKRAEQDDVAYKVRKLEHSTDATFPSLEGSNMMDSLRVYNDFRSAPSATRAYPQLYNTADAQWASSQVPYQNTRPLISLPGGMNQHFYNPKPYVDVQLEVDPALLLKNTSDIGTGTSTDNGNGNGNSTSAGTGASMSQQTFRPPTAMATNQLQSAPVPYRDVQYAPAAYVASPLDNADYYNRLPIWEEDVGLRPLETGSQFDEWMGGDQETG